MLALGFVHLPVLCCSIVIQPHVKLKCQAHCRPYSAWLSASSVRLCQSHHSLVCVRHEIRWNHDPRGKTSTSWPRRCVCVYGLSFSRRVLHQSSVTSLTISAWFEFASAQECFDVWSWCSKMLSLRCLNSERKGSLIVLTVFQRLW